MKRAVSRTTRTMRWVLAAGIVIISTISQQAAGQPASIGETAASQSTPPANVHIGIGGVYRPGNWTAIRIVDWESDDPATAFVPISAVETLDGNGVRVRYTQPTIGSEREPTRASAWAYAAPGTAAAPLVIYGESAGDGIGAQPIHRGRFSGMAIEPSKPWVVVIGDSLGIEQIGRNELLGRESSVAVSQIHRGADVPDQTAGWEGVDLLIINAPGQSILAELSQSQIKAIERWIHGGGRLFLPLGKDAVAMLGQSPWLAELAGLDSEPSLVRIDPAALETFTSSQTRLSTLDGISLTTASGRALLTGRTLARQPTQLVIERLVGLGRVGVAAFGLHATEIAGWPERLSLVTRLHPGLLDSDTEKRRESRSIASVPYDDLAGQLRSALDRFDSIRTIPFSILSVILLVLAALVGPLDYLLVNRVWGRPLIGWISFPITVISVAVLIIAMSNMRTQQKSTGAVAISESTAETQSAARSHPTGLRANRIEVVDINAVSQPAVARAMSLSHVSSTIATRTDWMLRLDTKWGVTFSDAARSVTLSRPYGYPGPTFGGIAILGEDRSMPQYEIQMSRTQAQSLHDDFAAERLASLPLAFPIAPAGSKGWMTTWAFTPTLGETLGLSQRRGNDLLTGSITNPLSVDLMNAMLVYGNWVYLLPTRFRAGQTIETIDSLRQKNFRWHLTRRESYENASRLQEWDVEMHSDLARIIEVMMFESSVGGRDYTGLGNRAMRGIDLSYVLDQGHAILYGQFSEPILQLDLADEQPTVSAVRVILPVAPPVQKSR